MMHPRNLSRHLPHWLCVLLAVRAVSGGAAELFAAAAAGLGDVRAATVESLRQREPSAFPDDGIALRLSGPVSEDVDTWHLRTGEPIAFGALRGDDPLRFMRDEQTIPVQTKGLATWSPPGSAFGEAVKWLRLDSVDSVEGDDRCAYRLVLADDEAGADVTPSMRIKEDAERMIIDNGRLEPVVNKPTDGEGDRQGSICRARCPWMASRRSHPARRVALTLSTATDARSGRGTIRQLGLQLSRTRHRLIQVTSGYRGMGHIRRYTPTTRAHLHR